MKCLLNQTVKITPFHIFLTLKKHSEYYELYLLLTQRCVVITSITASVFLYANQGSELNHYMAQSSVSYNQILKIKIKIKIKINPFQL